MHFSATPRCRHSVSTVDVRDENWISDIAGCTGLRSFAATPSGELLTVSAVNLRDGQLGFALNRLQDDGSRIAGSAQAPPVPLARLVGQDARFAGLSSIYHILMSPPMQSAADDRVYVLFEFPVRQAPRMILARAGRSPDLPRTEPSTPAGARTAWLVLEKGWTPDTGQPSRHCSSRCPTGELSP